MKIGQITQSYDNQSVQIVFIDESSRYKPKSIKMEFSCFNADSDNWQIFIERDNEFIEIPKEKENKR